MPPIINFIITHIIIYNNYKYCNTGNKNYNGDYILYLNSHFWLCYNKIMKLK